MRVRVGVGVGVGVGVRVRVRVRVEAQGCALAALLLKRREALQGAREALDEVGAGVGRDGLLEEVYSHLG